MQEFLILYKNSKSAKGDKKVGVFLPSFFKQNGEQIINIFASYCVYQFCIAQHDNCQIISLFPPGIKMYGKKTYCRGVFRTLSNL